MGRIRTVKPEFAQSQSMGRCSRDARLLFVLLWTLVDDSGRTRAASRMLASLLFPYDDDAPNLISGWLDELEAQGCIARYTVAGDDYLEVCNWAAHQKIDRPSKSKFPTREDSRGLVERSTLDQGSRTKDQGPGSESPPAEAVECAADRFADFWAAFDHRVAKPDAERAWRKAAKSPEISEAIIANAKAYAAATPDKKFRAHPATWLNRRGWEDELPAPRTGVVAPRLVAMSTQHIPNMPLGTPNCHCEGCTNYRAKRQVSQ